MSKNHKSFNNSFLLFATLSIIILVSLGVVITNINILGTRDVKTNAERKAVVPSSISINEDLTTLMFGSSVTFTVQANGLRGSEYPLVYLVCHQGGDLVYGQLDHPETTFILGGGSSRWWDNKGPASCHAELLAYGGKDRGYDTIRELARTAEFQTQ